MRLSLLIVAVVLGLASVVSADEKECCSVEDKKEIEWVWHRVWQSTNTERKIRIMSAVVHDIIEHHPEYKDEMAAKGVTDSKDATSRAYMIRLVHTFDNVINLFEDPLILAEQLKYMQKQFGTKDALKKTYFQAVAESLERVLPQVSSCFPTSAWVRCLERLADIISHGESDD